MRGGQLGQVFLSTWHEANQSRYRALIRGTVAVVATMVAVALIGVVGHRVFAPREVLTRPTVPYPPAEPVIDERPFGELRAAPLAVEGRLRIHAEKWRVWSDGPLGERYEATPYWSYRRWPAQVLGVVTAATPAGPMVVSQWSDGQLVAIDARQGAIVWRVSAPIQPRHYPGRRTGAAVVYEPRSLMGVRAGGQTVLILTHPGGIRGYDPATGAQLWQREVAGCEPLAWAGAGLVALPDCAGVGLTLVGPSDGRSVGRITWAGSMGAPAGGANPAGGAIPAAGGFAPHWTPQQAFGLVPEPALCEWGRTGCRLVTLGARAWLLGPDARLTPVPPVEPGALLAGDLVAYPTASGAAVRPLTDTTPLWTWKGRGRLVGGDAAGVYLLTDDGTVLQLSPAVGRLTAFGCAAVIPGEGWRAGHVYPTDDGYLAVERVIDSPRDPTDDRLYYYTLRPVALVQLYPPTAKPAWPSKFAACARP